MKKTRLIITRHGKTEWNKKRLVQGQTDIPLHPEGIEETKAFAQKLHVYSIDRIYTSHLQRAHQTATILQNLLSIDNLHTHTGLSERKFGPYEGVSWNVVDEQFTQKGINFFEQSHVGVESNEDFTTRVIKTLEQIASDHKGETILVVTHGGTIWQILSYFNQADPTFHVPNNCILIYDVEEKCLQFRK